MASGLPEELIDKQSLMSSYSSAVKMLELLTQPNFSPLLYLVQDSIHIGIAYAAIFLVKVDLMTVILAVLKITWSNLRIAPALYAAEHPQRN